MDAKTVEHHAEGESFGDARSDLIVRSASGACVCADAVKHSKGHPIALDVEQPGLRGEYSSLNSARPD